MFESAIDAKVGLLKAYTINYYPVNQRKESE
jgi:hypothetical protein